MLNLCPYEAPIAYMLGIRLHKNNNIMYFLFSWIYGQIIYVP